MEDKLTINYISNSIDGCLERSMVNIINENPRASAREIIKFINSICRVPYVMNRKQSLRWIRRK